MIEWAGIRALFESEKEDYYEPERLTMAMLLKTITLSMKAKVIEIKPYQLNNILIRFKTIFE